MKTAFLVVLALATVASAAAFSSCGSGTLTVSSLNVTPNPPVKGKSVEIDVIGSLAAAETGASLHYTISFIGIPVINKTKNVCTMDGFKCPIDAGAFKLAITEDIPSAAPSGSYDLKATLTGSDGKLMACVTDKLNIT